MTNPQTAEQEAASRALLAKLGQPQPYTTIGPTHGSLNVYVGNRVAVIDPHDKQTVHVYEAFACRSRQLLTPGDAVELRHFATYHKDRFNDEVGGPLAGRIWDGRNGHPDWPLPLNRDLTVDERWAEEVMF